MKNIPKVCYFYWNGAPMSYLHALSVISFLQCNPDWEAVIYVKEADKATDDSPTNPKYTDYNGKDYFDLVRTVSRAKVVKLNKDYSNIHSILISDIWRREILYENGGVYSDFDMLWLKPISELQNMECLGNPTDFECTVSFHELTHGFHNVSNIIAEKGSPFLKSLIDEAKKISPPYGDQSFGTDLLNNKYPGWVSIAEKFPRVLGLKYSVFYPYSTFDMKKLFEENDLSPLEQKDILGIHWFNGNPASKDYINKEDYHRNCSMTTILKKEGYL